MTNEETIVGLKFMKSFFKQWNMVEGYEEFCEMLDNAIEAVGISDKYRWHDLRKNPEDLPENYKEVLVYHTYYHYKANKILPEVETGWYAHKCWGGEAGKGNQNTVIAWKEIEPFEEEYT